MKRGPDILRIYSLRLLSSVLLSSLLLSGLLGQPVLAQDSAPADPAPQPITIEADRAEINEPEQISIYSGNVELTQGGLKIWSEVMTIYTLNNDLQRVVAEGKPVRYEQKRVDEETIRGHSQRLDYDANTERLLLIQDAELLQGENHFSGERIQYDLATKKVVASGAKEGDAPGSGRVQVTIQPKQDAGDKPKP